MPKKLLAIRMVDPQVSGNVLQDKEAQQKIMQQTIQIAQDNHFDGVVLDLEYNALAFDSVVTSITDFSTTFAALVKRNNLSFYQTFYGDTFYQGRPYDVKKIAEKEDGIFVMAYDFHKANGDPGPNFPLYDNSDDYTFQTMVHDFEKVVDKKKTTIVFGMFGYDWTVDDKGRSSKEASSLTTNEILLKFIAKCEYKNCGVNGSSSFETQVTYDDADNKKHIVWFEDLSSVGIKKEFLQTKGISTIGFWANGYF